MKLRRVCIEGSRQEEAWVSRDGGVSMLARFWSQVPSRHKNVLDVRAGPAIGECCPFRALRGKNWACTRCRMVSCCCGVNLVFGSELGFTQHGRDSCLSY